MAWSTETRDKAAVTRQQNKERSAAETISAQGFGESKVFAAPAGTFDIDPRLPACHIEGKLISEHYSEEQMAALRWAWTDEGFAAGNAGKSDIHVSVSDPLKKQLQRKKDDVLDRGMETWEASDPMKEVLDANPNPGFRRRFLSDHVVKNKGTRGWQPVIGDNGDPVKLGGMTLAEMPDERAKARNRHYAGVGNERLTQVQQRYMEGAQGSAVSDQ